MAARGDTSRICLQSCSSQADKHNSHSPRLLYPLPPPPPHPCASVAASHHFTSSSSLVHHSSVTLSPKVNKYFTLTSPHSPLTMIEDHHTSSNVNANTTSGGTSSVVNVQQQQQHQQQSASTLRATYNDWENRWESSTVLTANTSVPSVSLDMDLNLVGKGEGSTSGYSSNNGAVHFEDTTFHSRCHTYLGTIVSVSMCASAFISPLLMIFLPKMHPVSWKVSECGPECDGPLISLSFKLLLLLISSWLLFNYNRHANLPRIDMYRFIILSLVLLLLISYWLFFLVRSSDRFIADYEITFRELLLSYPVPLVDNLLWIHFIAVLLFEIRHRCKQYYVKVVRSPDGVSKSYTLGELSIQRTAIFILERYYKDFTIYNPYLESSNVPYTVNGKKINNNRNNGVIGNGSIKVYDLDVNSTSTPNSNQLSLFNTSSHQRNNNISGNNSLHTLYSMRVNELTNERSKSHSVVGVERASDKETSHRRSKRPGGSVRGSSGNGRGSNHHSHHHRSHSNDRFHEEYEFERRVKKRRARLVTSAEEAFTHIKLVADDHQGSAVTMDPLETAQAIFPSIARSLQKFLRVTRQQNRHTLQSILDHLSVAMKYGLSAKAFLEKYISSGPVLMDDNERRKPMQSWGLVSDYALSRSIRDGAIFMLRQGEISLLITVSSLPYFDLQEEVIDPKSNRFVLRLNSETSV